MNDPVPTTFEDDEDPAAFQALFNLPPYDPAAALLGAQALLPDKLKCDQHWLPLMLICANGGLEWIIKRVNFTMAGPLNYEPILDRLGILSSGEYVLAVLALHLFNDSHKLPDDGLTNLRLLDDWHFELTMHAIRIDSRGLKLPSPRGRGAGGEGR